MTLGAAGCVVADATGVQVVPAVTAQLVDVTGAGDALIAGTLSGLLSGAPLVDAVQTGSLAAALTVEGEGSVRPDLSPALLQGARSRIAALMIEARNIR